MNHRKKRSRKKKSYVKGWKGYKDRLERWQVIHELRQAQQSLSSIGRMLGMSKQRVHQIFNNYPQRDKVGVI